MAGTAAGAAKARAAQAEKRARERDAVAKGENAGQVGAEPRTPAETVMAGLFRPGALVVGGRVAGADGFDLADLTPEALAEGIIETAAPEAAALLVRTLRNSRAAPGDRVRSAALILAQAERARVRRINSRAQPENSQAALLALAERIAAAAERRRQRAAAVDAELVGNPSGQAT